MADKIGMLERLACMAITALIPNFAEPRMPLVEQQNCIVAESNFQDSLYQHNDKNPQYRAKLDKLEEKLLKEAKEFNEWCKKNKLEYDAYQFAKKILEIVPRDKAEFLKQNTEKDTSVKPLEKRVEFSKKFEAFIKKYSNELNDIIKWCKTQKLEEEKENAVELALKLDPNNPFAAKERDEIFVKGYGRLPKETAEKIISGLREFNGKWLPKAEVDKLRKNWENAWELKSEHFTIKTNTSEEEGLEMLAMAEEEYMVFKSEIERYVKLKDQTGFTIYYCTTKEDYNKIIPPEKRGANVPGFNHGKNIYMRKARDPHETTTPELALRHETAHALTLHLFSDSPPSISDYEKKGNWIVEGIAVFFEPGWEKLASGVYKIGLPNRLRHEDLAHAKMIPLEKFVTAKFPDGELSGNEFYALAYALAHFLHAKKPLEFWKYIELTFSQGVDEKNFEKIFGPPAALNQEFQQYCRALQGK